MAFIIIHKRILSYRHTINEFEETVNINQTSDREFSLEIYVSKDIPYIHLEFNSNSENNTIFYIVIESSMHRIDYVVNQFAIVYVNVYVYDLKRKCGIIKCG